MLEVPQSRKIFFYLILVITTFLAFKVLENYMTVVVLSFVYSITVEPLYKVFHRLFNRSEHVASLVTLLISFVLLFAPIIFTINLFVMEALSFRDSVEFDSIDFTHSIELKVNSVYGLVRNVPILNQIIHPTNISATIENSANSISSFLASKAVDIGSSSAAFFTNFIIFLFLVYFIIPSLPKLKKLLQELSPLDDNIDKLYIDRTIAMIATAVKGTFIVALAQGMLGGVFLWLAGVDYILTLTLAMIVASIIPVVGTAFVTIPIAILLYLNGQPIPATIVLLGQLIVISNIDNIIRAELVSKEASLHPALMLISIFGGISMFGIWGFIYGPVIMILFVTSLEIYQKHIKY